MTSPTPAEETSTVPRNSSPDKIPYPEGVLEFTEGAYSIRFARTPADLEELQRLRFEVFNRELGEGFASSWKTGRDEDRFDNQCHHLMMFHTADQKLVGTYRMQVADAQAGPRDFYCAEEFDLSQLPQEVVSRSVELGRACILKEHRNGLGLYTLWRGLASYLTWSGKRFLFGCCSLTSQDPREAESVRLQLKNSGKVSADWHVDPRPNYAVPCEDHHDLPETPIPRLFGTYLRYGALICGAPAIDRAFGTIDYFIVLDIERIDKRLHALFFAGLEDSQHPASGA